MLAASTKPAGDGRSVQGDLQVLGAGLFEQGAGPVEVLSALGEAVGVVLVALAEQVVADHTRAGQGAVDELLAVGDEEERLAYPLVVEGGPVGLHREALHGAAGEPHDRDLSLALVGARGGGVEFVGVFDLSAEECVDAGGLLVGDDELELVEVWGALPIVVVAAEDRRAAGGEGHEPEGAGADRLRVEAA